MGVTADDKIGKLNADQANQLIFKPLLPIMDELKGGI
jgi:hypothetical protein